MLLTYQHKCCDIFYILAWKCSTTIGIRFYILHTKIIFKYLPISCPFTPALWKIPDQIFNQTKNFIYLHIINVIHLSSTCYCIVLKSTLFCSGDGNLFFSYLISFYLHLIHFKATTQKMIRSNQKVQGITCELKHVHTSSKIIIFTNIRTLVKRNCLQITFSSLR